MKDRQVGLADQLMAIETLLDRGFGRSSQQLDVGHNITDRLLENPSDEACLLLIESEWQPKEYNDLVTGGGW